MRLQRAAVPAADGTAPVVEYRHDIVAGEHGVAAFDVAEVLEDGAGRQAAALRAEVPLQVADPQHQFGDGRRARVEFEAEELVRVDGEALGFEQGLAVADVVQLVEHFAFEALQVFQRDVEEVAAAAGRIEHAQGTQLVVEGAQLGDGLFLFALSGEQHGGALHVGPALAQRLDHGGLHQAVDVGARRVVRAQRVALVHVERAFEQGAEDGRLDLGPVGFGGFEQQRDLRAGQWQNLGRFEELAVELRQGGAHRGRIFRAGVHVAPQAAEQGGNRGGVGVAFAEQRGELALGQQPDILGEHAEEAAGKKAGDGFGGVAGAFERLGDFGEVRRDLARDARGVAGRVEVERVAPYRREALADRVVAQIGEADAVGARIGKGHIGATALRELGVELDDVADVDHDDEGRAALASGQGAGVVLGLAASAQQGVVEGFRRTASADFLGFQHEGAALVAVDATGAAAAVAMTEADRPLEHVVLRGGGMRRIDAEQGAEVDDETLRRRQLGRGDALPAGYEGIDGWRGTGGGAHDVGIVTAIRTNRRHLPVVAVWHNWPRLPPCQREQNQEQHDCPQSRIPLPSEIGRGRFRARRAGPLCRGDAAQSGGRRLLRPDHFRCGEKALAVRPRHAHPHRRAGSGARPGDHLRAAARCAEDNRQAGCARHARGDSRAVATNPDDRRGDRRGAQGHPRCGAAPLDARAGAGQRRPGRSRTRPQRQRRHHRRDAGQGGAGDAIDGGRRRRAGARRRQGHRLFVSAAPGRQRRCRSGGHARLAGGGPGYRGDPGAVPLGFGGAQVHVGGARGGAQQAGGGDPRRAERAPAHRRPAVQRRRCLSGGAATRRLGARRHAGRPVRRRRGDGASAADARRAPLRHRQRPRPRAHRCRYAAALRRTARHAVRRDREAPRQTAEDDLAAGQSAGIAGGHHGGELGRGAFDGAGGSRNGRRADGLLAFTLHAEHRCRAGDRRGGARRGAQCIHLLGRRRGDAGSAAHRRGARFVEP